MGADTAAAESFFLSALALQLLFNRQSPGLFRLFPFQHAPWAVTKLQLFLSITQP